MNGANARRLDPVDVNPWRICYDAYCIKCTKGNVYFKEISPRDDAYGAIHFWCQSCGHDWVKGMD